jgi:hypothetical protein
MIINLHIKIVYLVKADPKAPVIPFCKENTLAGKHLGFAHAIHKIEIFYTHKADLYVVVPV